MLPSMLNPRRHRRRCLVAVLLTGVSLWSLGAPAGGQDPGELYAKAQAAQQAGDLRAAAVHYEQLVRLLPDLAEARVNLGSIYYQMREDAKAEAALNEAIRLNPQLGAAPYFFLGVIASRNREHEQASRRLERAEKLDPSNRFVSYYLGEAYFATRRYRAAAERFRKAVAERDFRLDAYYYLSKTYGALSGQALERLRAAHPRSHYLDLARGHYHEGRKNWREAAEAYRNLLDREPAAAGISKRLQWVARRAAEEGLAGAPPPLPDGERLMLSLLYSPPSDREIDAMLAESGKRLLAHAGPGESAEALYRQAEEYQIASYLTSRWIGRNDPDSYRGRQLRAQLHEARGETDDAVREYRAALRLKPDLQNVHFAIGSMLWSRSRLEEARPELEAELRINPSHPEARYVLADILQIEGRTDEAKRHLLEALRLAPDLFEARLAIERIYFAEGQFAKALEQMRIAASLSPADPTPHYRMSMIHRRLGSPEEARKELETFQRLQGR